MPDTFILVNADGSDQGLYRASQFGRNENGEYVCAGHGGSPLFLRVLKQDGNHLVCTSEDRRERREYEMLPMRESSIERDEDDRPVASVPRPVRPA